MRAVDTRRGGGLCPGGLCRALLCCQALGEKSEERKRRVSWRPEHGFGGVLVLVARCRMGEWNGWLHHMNKRISGSSSPDGYVLHTFAHI